MCGICFTGMKVPSVRLPESRLRDFAEAVFLSAMHTSGLL
jgi:hypothetical protein